MEYVWHGRMDTERPRSFGVAQYFGGPAVNAARGVSEQVTGAVKGLIGGFQSAVNPQLTKTYAANDSAATCRLLCKSSKFSYFCCF